MTTSLDNIPMKTNIGVKTDDSDDPVVKDILNEFQQELKINNGYEINYDSNHYNYYRNNIFTYHI